MSSINFQEVAARQRATRGGRRAEVHDRVIAGTFSGVYGYAP